MKVLLFLLLFLPAVAGAQQLVLLDRKFKEPFSFSDTVTLQDAANGAFPLYTHDLPAIIQQLQAFVKKLDAGERLNNDTNVLRGEHCLLSLSKRENYYNCVLDFKSKELSIPLLVGRGNRAATLRQLRQFMEYLRQNKAAMMADTNITSSY